MPRILALDYGTKRTGIAATDPLQLIATGLTTVPSAQLRSWLTTYFAAEAVERVIIGMPLSLDGSPTDATKPVKDFIRLFKKDHPTMPIETVDEAYSSRLAVQALVASGVKKKDRREKGRVDEMAATLLLQEYLAQKG
ncbi:MAG: Holliday junction resolvase RuvX [Chitinophagaceae bacterium]|jgi:putative Holliday junction resolvase|nr:Holliday junction resolvase RuvX [Chitinophagaceae bacterium]